MKLGELFVQLTTKGDTKELDNTLKQLEKAQKLNAIDLNTKRQLKKASSEEEKQLILKNAEIEKNIVNTKEAISKQNAHMAALRGTAGALIAFVAGATVAYHAIDRMINALADANQKLINFNRQTGISLGTLNKYASASSAVNRNATIEGTAQSLQNVASNLYDIQMGRGDISPYQELAFVGGRAFNPANMSVEQVIENVRQAIKGVGDIQATNIITRMGFSPDDLMMLRMSREEFEKVQGLFLDPASREALNKYGLQLHIVALQFQLLRDKGLLKIMPSFIQLTQHLLRVTTLWAEFIDKIISLDTHIGHLHVTFEGLAKAIGLVVTAINPLARNIFLIYLVVEDIVGYFLGWKSVTGVLLEAIPKLGKALKKAFDDWKDVNKILKDFDKKGFWDKVWALTKAQAVAEIPGNAQQAADLANFYKGREQKANEYNEKVLNTIKDTLFKIFNAITDKKLSYESDTTSDKIASAIEAIRPPMIGNPIPTVNTNSQVTNNNGTNNMQMNNTYNINGNQDVQRQVENGNLIAYNTIIAQNGIAL